MKLNLYTFASLMSNATPEATMFGIMVATKLDKAYDRIGKCIDAKNPKTMSALLGFALSYYDEYMANTHSDVAPTDPKYWSIFAEYCGRLNSLCNWENKKNPITVLNSTLSMRKRSATK